MLQERKTMKFEHEGIKFEVSNVDQIVINSVRRIIKPAETIMDKHGHTSVKPARVTGKKEKVVEKGTRVWFRLKFAKGTRWAKFRYHGEIPEQDLTDPSLNLADAEQWETSEGVQKIIMDAMQRPYIRLWFSGTYVNIEICENHQEVQRIKAQEERRKSRSRAAKILKSPNLNEILRKAISSAGAQVRQESISTPFGPIPVMTITGTGDLMRDMERIEKTGQFISLDEAAKQLKIPRR
jgi:hypothetical protein